MDTTHANVLDRSILVKWANPHAVPHAKCIEYLGKKIDEINVWLGFMAYQLLFYGISTTLYIYIYIYIYQIYDFETHLEITFLNEPELIFFSHS